MTATVDPATGERSWVATRRTAWPVAFSVRFLAALTLFAVGALVFRSESSAPAPPVVAVAGWTVGVAVILWWWRARLDRVANLLRFGRQATGYEAVRALLQRMSTGLLIDEVVPQLAESVGRSTHATRTEVRINLDDGQQSSQVWPPAAHGAGQPLTAQIRYLGDAVGSLELYAPGSDADRRRRLLAEVSGPAGVAMSAVRLAWSLRRRLADLVEVNEQIRASQRRLVSARLDARAAMQKEVEQQVLVHLGAAEDLLAGAPSELSDTAITAAADEMSAALDSLRSIARGIYPPRLSEAGLAVSLDSWRDRLPAPASLYVDEAAAAAHRYPDVEACLYFVLVEAGEWAISNGCTALAINVTAGQQEIRFQQVLTGITTWPTDGELTVSDRLAAFGGTVETTVEPAGNAVTMTGRMPLARASTPMDAVPTAQTLSTGGR